MSNEERSRVFFGIVLWVALVCVLSSVVRVVATEAETVDMLMGLVNAAPVVTEEHISLDPGFSLSDDFGGNIDSIVPGVGLTVYLNGRISDANGWEDVRKIYAQARRSDRDSISYARPVVSRCAGTEHVCYRASSDGMVPECAFERDASDPSGLTVVYECQIDLRAFASYTAGGPSATVNGYVWKWEVLALDADGAGSAVAHLDKEINAFLGLSMPASIDYGSRSLGYEGDTSVGTEDILVGQAANDTQDAYVYATDMSCDTGVVPVSNLQFGVGIDGESTDAGFDGTGMETYVDEGSSVTHVAELNVPLQTDPSSPQAVVLRNEVRVPSSGVAGACAGTVTIIAKTSR